MSLDTNNTLVFVSILVALALVGLGYGKFARREEKIVESKKIPKPDGAEEHINLGRTYGELDRWREASAEYQQAIRIDPDSAEAHFGLGMAYDSLKDGTNAILHMAEAEKLLKRNSDTDRLVHARRLLRDFYAKYGDRPSCQ